MGTYKRRGIEASPEWEMNYKVAFYGERSYSYTLPVLLPRCTCKVFTGVTRQCNIDKKSITREAVSTLTSSVIQCWYYCTKSFISIRQLFRANKPVNIVLRQQYTATLWYAEFYDSVIIELSRFRLEMKYRLCERSFKEFNDFFFISFLHGCVLSSFFLSFFFFFCTISRYRSLQ